MEKNDIANLTHSSGLLLSGLGKRVHQVQEAIRCQQQHWAHDPATVRGSMHATIRNRRTQSWASRYMINVMQNKSSWWFVSTSEEHGWVSASYLKTQNDPWEDSDVNTSKTREEPKRQNAHVLSLDCWGTLSGMATRQYSWAGKYGLACSAIPAKQGQDWLQGGLPHRDDPKELEGLVAHQIPRQKGQRISTVPENGQGWSTYQEEESDRPSGDLWGHCRNQSAEQEGTWDQEALAKGKTSEASIVKINLFVPCNFSNNIPWIFPRGIYPCWSRVPRIWPGFSSEGPNQLSELKDEILPEKI